MIILGGSYYNGPKSIFTGTAIIKDVNKIVLQNGIYDRLYVSEDISKQEIVDTYTSEAAKSVKIESGINRIETIDVYGKTTQEGTGDASPNNVREIENAGKFNKIAVINGTTGFYIRTVENGFVVADVSGISDVTKNSKVVSTYLKAYSLEDETAKEGIRAFSSSSGFGISIKQSKLTGTDASAVKAYFSAHPLTVGYQSTEDTGKFYTGISVEQGDEYRCEIIELQAPLHEGDTLETNVQSEYDQEYVLTGQENFILQSSLNSSLFIAENITENAENYTAVSNTYINGGNAWNATPDKSVINSNNGSLGIRDTSFATAEAFKSALAQRYAAGTPVRVFLKSVSGGAPKNIKREEHAKKTRVFTGTEDDLTYFESSSYLAIPTPGVSGDTTADRVLGNVKCSHFKNEYPGIDLIYAQPKYNRIIIVLPSVFDSLESAKAYFAAQLAAGTPVTIEYELATPEVFADEPVIVGNKAGEYTVSFESTGRVKLKPVINQEGWSDDTIIDAGFNGDLNGGNVDFMAESIDKIRIKRRKKGTANWVDLKDIIINVPDDFTFTFYDLFAANAAEYTYAVVPVIGDIEGNLSTVDIQSMFNGFFIADKNTIYGTEYNVNVGAATKNEKSSVVQTLGAKYPFIIDNGYNNYYTVPISLFFYNPNLDWQQNVQYRQTIVEWLHNGTAKIFKSEDGRIWLAKVTTAPVLTPGSNLNITSIDFSITEIGESNSTEDLYNSGLLSLIKES